MHEENCFVTLTYDDKYLPENGNLVKEDFQKFFKRLRKNTGREIRYFACGEYGDQTNRPHYHAILFGINFSEDRKKHSEKQGKKYYVSPFLAKTWGLGHALISEFSYSTAAYTARYVLKKMSGKLAEEHYQRVNVITGELVQVQPEFALMSRNPGIGRKWYDKYKKDAFPSDFLVHEGKKHNVPRYYAEILKQENEHVYKEVKQKRINAMNAQKHNSTPDRLHVRETVKKSQLTQLKRSI